jgi:hypothetical protein
MKPKGPPHMGRSHVLDDIGVSPRFDVDAIIGPLKLMILCGILGGMTIDVLPPAVGYS